MLRNTLNTFITATLIMLLGVSSTAQAVVPMGDLMGSTSVTFGDQAKPAEDSSALRIDLVPAEPTIREYGGPADREVEGNKVTVTYTITSRANGPDGYTLAAPYDPDAEGNENAGELTTNILGAGVEQDPARVNLGATAAISSDGNVITVPHDKNGGAGSVNGIEAGETVIIGNGDTEYTVAEVSNTGEGPSTIRLEGDGPASLALGDRIAERNTFKVVVSGNALLNPAEQVTFALDVTGTSLGDGNQIGTARLDHIIQGIPIDPSVDRYVRNLTDPTGNPTDDPDVESTLFDSGEGDNNYYKTGVSAKDTHEVEILIVLNAGNQGPQTDIVLNETISHFLEYVADTVHYHRNKFDSFGIDTRNRLHDCFQPFASIPDVIIPCSLDALRMPKNTSVHITYKVKVMGGEGDDDPGAKEVIGEDGDDSEDSDNVMVNETVIGSTYAGCLLRNHAVREQLCLPDGSPWQDRAGANNNLACWSYDIVTDEGKWVVGANGWDPLDAKQDDLRFFAERERPPAKALDGYYARRWDCASTIGVGACRDAMKCK